MQTAISAGDAARPGRSNACDRRSASGPSAKIHKKKPRTNVVFVRGFFILFSFPGFQFCPPVRALWR